MTIMCNVGTHSTLFLVITNFFPFTTILFIRSKTRRNILLQKMMKTFKASVKFFNTQKGPDKRRREDATF